MRYWLDRLWFKYLSVSMALLFIGLLASESVPPGFSQTRYNSSEVIVQRGDAIKIILWEGWNAPKKGSLLSHFQGEFVIDGNGNIRFPVIGLVNIAGKNADQIEKQLREIFQPFANNPDVTIIPLIRVTLIGAFKRPGTYRVAVDATYWELVERARGPEGKMDFENTIVVRNGKEVFKNVIRAFEKGQSLMEMGIQSGDQIYAPEKKKITFELIYKYVSLSVSFVTLLFTIAYYKERKNK